jgi:hypothetical protein
VTKKKKKKRAGKRRLTVVEIVAVGTLLFEVAKEVLARIFG